MERIETFQDLLDILEAKPEWAQALREKLLTPELLALPERFAAFVETVNAFILQTNRRFEALEKDVTELKTDVAELKSDMTEVKADVAVLKSDMTEVKANVADLKGHTVPLAAQRMTGAIAQAINVRRPRWLDTTQIVDIADDAEEEGKADIPANELESFRAIDLAMNAVDKASGTSCYVVIECSYTLTRADITRVKRNAEHMTRFTGRPAIPIATANSIPEAVSTFAEEQNVTCVTITNKADSPR